MAPPNDELDPRAFPMLAILPASVLAGLRRHFYAGVTDAEIRFPFNAADEDALTGALGQALIEPAVVIVETSDGTFRWRTTSHKLRGRGAHAPEKDTGADGIFQLDVFDEAGKLLIRKGLLFQSKVNWTGTDRRLLRQAERLMRQSASSIVIDYSVDGYRAIAASDVIHAGGNRREVPSISDKRLSEVLGNEFVGCIRGDLGLYWDPTSEQLITNGEQQSDEIPSYLIETRVETLQ
jgi:hypothetical protein